MKLSKEEKEWWSTVDLNSPYLSKIWSGMLGTVEQRVSQLYIIRNNLNLK